MVNVVARSTAARAPEPKMSRKHAAGADSSRSFLFTILGEFVLPQGGSAWTSTFLGALDKLGLEERASRQALMRTAADGWLHSERVGRRTCWSVTPSGKRVLIEGRERIFDFRGVQEDWDGRWLLVLARVPDAARADGQKLRTRLRWAGLGSPTPGVWASTHVDRRVAVETAIADANLGSETHIFISEHVGGAQLSAMVRQAWDLEAIEQSYKKFLLDFQVETTSEPLERLVRLAHAWRRLAMIDPALPLELLPAEWDGVEAAERFHRLHAAWRDEARAQWKALPQ